MRKRVTIKDIASKAGVSVGSVHCALAGKAGVSEETRARILEIARECDYRPNAVAASLKRKAMRIAAVLPGPDEDNRYYFTQVWEGFRDCMRAMRDFNIETVEAPYYGEVNDHAREMADLLDRAPVDGLLTVGYMNHPAQSVFRDITGRGVPAVLVGGDIPESGRLCCVQPDYAMIGRTLAELLSRQIPADGNILLCAGDVAIPSHYLIMLGFEAFMRERNLSHPLHKIHHANKELHALQSRIRDELERRPDIVACCSVNAHGSLALGAALREAGKAGSMPAVGSDVFEENVRLLREGVFTNLVHKNPYLQAYLAAECLVEHLLHDTAPEGGMVFVGSEIVFQSNVSAYHPPRRYAGGPKM